MARLSSIKCLSDMNSQKMHELLVIGVFKDASVAISGKKDLSNFINDKIKLDDFSGKEGKMLSSYGIPDGYIKRWLLVGFGDKKNFSSDKLRAIAANIASYANKNNLKSISLDAKSLGLSKSDYLQALCEGLVLGSYEFLNYKSKVENENSLKTAFIIGNVDSKIADKGFSIGESVSLARDLGNHPANILTPTYFANESKRISKAKNMSCKVFDVSKFEKMGLGSFYGVARGAKEPAKMIIVEYKGGSKNQKPIALVGKGLTFDTGGISLKPGARMDEMKFDMCGGATVMGLMNAVSILQPKLNIVFAIGATENMPGSDAQRPGDIVTAYNGKTIEVLNTDAEGRLVLADALTFTEKKFKPKFIIDLATLTGAIIVSLGEEYAGLFSNNDELSEKLYKAGLEVNEKVWRLPLNKNYDKLINSSIADVQNINYSGGAGSITAAQFLQRFILKNTPWAHLDIAGMAFSKKAANLNPSGATGFGVRLLNQLIDKYYE